MAAQKLTKARLIQILATMILLLVAFFWRTFEHSQRKNVDNEPSLICKINQTCQLTFKNGVQVSLLIQKPNKTQVVVTQQNNVAQLTLASAQLSITSQPAQNHQWQIEANLPEISHWQLSFGEQYTVRFNLLNPN